jgi:hypothetical protein
MPSKIADLAVAYVGLMAQLGNPKTEIKLANELPVLFAVSVRKIENGTIIVSSEQELQRQLTNALAFAAPWKIQTQDVIVDELKKSAVVNFSWVSEKIGSHITTVIIKFDKNNKICELNEVYNTSQGILHPSLSSAAPSSAAPSSAASSSAISSSASSTNIADLALAYIELMAQLGNPKAEINRKMNYPCFFRDLFAKLKMERP